MLAGAALLAFCLGSLHAFSVLIEPMEQNLATSRSSISLAYSLATMALVAGVLVLPALLARHGVRRLTLLCGLGGSAGLLVAAASSGLAGMLIGFGLMFGFCNGLGYGLSIERAGVARPDRPGLGFGIVTAAYCAGAIVFSKLFAAYATMEDYGFALLLLAGAVALSGLIAAVLLGGGVVPASAHGGETKRLNDYGPLVIHLWSIYFLAVFAGLMALGHAAAMVAAKGGTPAQAAYGAMIISLGSATGSIAAGNLSDRFTPRVALLTSIAGALAAAVAMLWADGAVAMIAALGVAGLSYGALITAIPAATNRYFERAMAMSAFGRVFTAWGIAGLAGPWAGGLIFDLTGAYFAAIALAVVCSGAALALAARLPAALTTITATANERMQYRSEKP